MDRMIKTTKNPFPPQNAAIILDMMVSLTHILRYTVCMKSNSILSIIAVIIYQEWYSWPCQWLPPTMDKAGCNEDQGGQCKVSALLQFALYRNAVES